MTTYPDVLGFIADQRQNVGAVQIAVAVHPPSAPAGTPRALIALLQNTQNAPVKVGLRFDLPAKDSAGRKGRFIVKPEQIELTLGAGEVGYATVTLATAPDASAGQYAVGVECVAKATDSKARIRPDDGGAPLDLSTVNDEARARIEQLKRLPFSAKKRGMMRGSMLDAPLTITTGQRAQAPAPKPGYIRLWTLADADDETLIAAFGATFAQHVTPTLTVDALFAPLSKITHERFKAAGYPLTKPETMTAVRLLLATINAGKTPAVPLPLWVRAYFKLMADSPKSAHEPVKVLALKLYDDLVLSAALDGLRLVERESGESLGSDDDVREFADAIVARLQGESPMTFSHAYLPLIIGGLVVTDQVLRTGERIQDVMNDIRLLLDHRADEINSGDGAVFEIAENIMVDTLRKYGFYGSSR